MASFVDTDEELVVITVEGVELTPLEQMNLEDDLFPKELARRLKRHYKSQEDVFVLEFRGADVPLSITVSVRHLKLPVELKAVLDNTGKYLVQTEYFGGLEAFNGELPSDMRIHHNVNSF